MQVIKTEEEIRETMPISDYILTEEDKQDIEDGRSEYKAGSFVDHKQIKNLIGI